MKSWCWVLFFEICLPLDRDTRLGLATYSDLNNIDEQEQYNKQRGKAIHPRIIAGFGDNTKNKRC